MKFVYTIRAVGNPASLADFRLIHSKVTKAATDAARMMRVSRQMLHRVLAGGADVTPEMALRIGKFCGNGPEIWLSMQKAVSLWDARQAIGAELAEIPTMGRTAAVDP